MKHSDAASPPVAPGDWPHCWQVFDPSGEAIARFRTLHDAERALETRPGWENHTIQACDGRPVEERNGRVLHVKDW